MVFPNFPENRTFVIAEAGVNHDGEMEKAFEMIKIAKNIGADSIKFQSYKTKNLLLENADKPDYQKKNLPDGLSQYQMLKNLELSKNQTLEIKEFSDKLGIPFMSTSYDIGILKWLDGLDVPAHKLASIDIVDHRLVEAACSTNKPVILSSAMATLDEVQNAVEIFDEYGKLGNLTILQCVFNYPCEVEDLNLNVIKTYKELFGIKSGLSDHSTSIYPASFAVIMGASVVEKHFTLDRTASGPDHIASTEPNDFRKMIELIRMAELSKGKPYKTPLPVEISSRTISRKSLVALEDIPKGTVLTSDMIGAKRPGSGLFPTKSNLDLFIGKKAKINIKSNSILRRAMIE